MSEKLTQLNEDDLSTKSQATYFFDCGNGAKGSFCCILKKGTEYFILTAGHNIIKSNNKVRDENKSTENEKKGATYYLRNRSNNVELELIKNYKPNGYDTALLKINKITEGGNAIYDITDRNSNNNDITKSEDFYKNAIKFKKNYYKNENEAKDKKGVLVGNQTRNGLSVDFLYENSYDAVNQNEFDSNDFFALNNSGIGGDSGGAIFTNQNKLLGIYIGNFTDIDKTNNPKIKGRCRHYYSINQFLSNFDIC